jgi:hypothetical protein
LAFAARRGRALFAVGVAAALFGIIVVVWLGSTRRFEGAERATTSGRAASGFSSGAGAQSAAISGRVRDAHGLPIAGAEVGASDLGIALAKSDAQGAFVLSGLQPGRVSLFALAPGFAPARAENVAVGAHDVLLVLPRPARIGGQLSLPNGSARVLVSLCRTRTEAGPRTLPAEGRATNGELCVARRLFSAPAERYELERLAPGNYALVAELEGRPPLRHPVAIAAGANVQGPALAWP